MAQEEPQPNPNPNCAGNIENRWFRIITRYGTPSSQTCYDDCFETIVACPTSYPCNPKEKEFTEVCIDQISCYFINKRKGGGNLAKCPSPTRRMLAREVESPYWPPAELGLKGAPANEHLGMTGAAGMMTMPSLKHRSSGELTATAGFFVGIALLVSYKKLHSKFGPAYTVGANKQEDMLADELTATV